MLKVTLGKICRNCQCKVLSLFRSVLGGEFALLIRSRKKGLLLFRTVSVLLLVHFGAVLLHNLPLLICIPSRFRAGFSTCVFYVNECASCILDSAFVRFVAVLNWAFTSILYADCQCRRCVAQCCSLPQDWCRAVLAYIRFCFGSVR